MEIMSVFIASIDLCDLVLAPTGLGAKNTLSCLNKMGSYPNVRAQHNSSQQREPLAGSPVNRSRAAQAVSLTPPSSGQAKLHPRHSKY